MKKCVLIATFISHRCYFFYCLAEGITTIEDVANTLKSKLLFFSCLTILYDLPRLYLNVNLFGCLCSFYYNFIEQVTAVTTLQYDKSG